MSKLDDVKCRELRKNIFLAGYRGGTAHLASCFSAVEILYSLYIKGIMRHDPTVPDWPERDRFLLSKGHAGLALYAVLAMAGYITEEELFSYLQPHCHIGGEPNLGDAPGIEASTGSLGHGLSTGIGMAAAQKLDGNGAKTFVLLGDGESQEGTVWEAAMSAASLLLDNLIVVLDCNGVQKAGSVKETIRLENWTEKWSAFGWNTAETDGHDVEALRNTFVSLPVNGKPSIVIAHTVKGKGVSIMENDFKWHFRLPNRKELKCFLDELGLTAEDLRE